MFTDFNSLKNKKIFITGHTGFIGSWLVLWLETIGSDLVGYALDPKNDNDNYTLCYPEGLKIDYRYDIRDKKVLFNAISEEKPDVIIHLAAQSLVLESFKNPVETIEVNTLGTVNILESFRINNFPELLVVMTTDKVYENREEQKNFREDDRLGGNDPYSSSKSSAELIINAYRKSYFENQNKKVFTVRAGNVLGGGDWSANRIIPDCVRSIERGERIRIRNPKSVRPWQHVLEPVRGLLQLTELILKDRTSSGDSWNIGPTSGIRYSVKDVTEKFIKCFGKGSYGISENTEKFSESGYLSLDVSKASEKFGWKQVFDLDETIDLTAQWYKNYQTFDVKEMCLKQIDKYVSKWKYES